MLSKRIAYCEIAHVNEPPMNKHLMTFVGAMQYNFSWLHKWSKFLSPLYHANNRLVRDTKGGSITVPLTSCLTGLDQPVLQIKTKIGSCHTADCIPFKQEVNSTVILPPLAFPGLGFKCLSQPSRLEQEKRKKVCYFERRPKSILKINRFCYVS